MEEREEMKDKVQAGDKRKEWKQWEIIIRGQTLNDWTKPMLSF